MEARSNFDYKINIALSENEFFQLESRVIEGQLIFKDLLEERTRNLAEKDLQISLGPLSYKSEHVFVELLTSPKSRNKDYRRVAIFFVRISNEGYRVMKTSGRIEEKNDLGGSIEIYRREIFRQ